MPLPDFLSSARKRGLVVHDDPVSRYLYSTDASIYQIPPLAVGFPRDEDELTAFVALAAEHRVPILPRGAGSSLAGQAVGEAVILDLSRHLDRVIAIDAAARTATVQPGVVLKTLNEQAEAYGLQFGPDPASAERATVGGVVGNNATGAHSILYGMAADHLLQAEVVFADGTVGELAPIAPDAQPSNPTMARLLRIANELRQRETAATLQSHWPKVWRRASGYSLNYLLPWTPSRPPQWYDRDLPYPPVPAGKVPLQALLAGSEGTLAVMRRATVRLVAKPRHTALAILPYPTVEAACDDAPRLLSYAPSAVELLPKSIWEAARSAPAYASLLDFLPAGDPAALLIVEFAADDPRLAQAQARALSGEGFLALDDETQSHVWQVRKVGLGLLMARHGDAKPISFMEDITVPVEHLGDFVRSVQEIMREFGTEAEFYAHASAGCLHIRPALNLKDTRDRGKLRAIARAAMEAGIQLGGVPSGEHGDGLARSEFLEAAFGPEIMGWFRKLKAAADPENILNPGKIVDAPRMDTHLRYGEDYAPQGWTPVMDFSSSGGVVGAIETCNGAGVCRKTDGLMCPTFQATRDEDKSTRGRANLLRAMIAGHLPAAEEAAYRALDLCVACKGCRSECPSGVDMAKLKYEFLHRYYQHHARKLRDWFFGYFGSAARFLWPLAPLLRIANWKPLRTLVARSLGIAPQRELPLPRRAPAHRPQAEQPTVLYLADPFTRYFEPEVESATLRLLDALGERVAVVPHLGAGRPLISKGFLTQAKAEAHAVVAAIRRLDPEGRLPVVGAEPSEIYTLQDEYPDLLPHDPYVAALAKRAWLVDEFLARHAGWPALWQGAPPWEGEPVLLHGHCYQKARPPADDGLPVGQEATAAMLETAGVPVEIIPSGCCGMAGAFGYEAEHYDLSLQIGELVLFPAVREAGEGREVVAPGTSCRAQIEHGTGHHADHPLVLLARRLEG